MPLMCKVSIFLMSPNSLKVKLPTFAEAGRFSRLADHTLAVYLEYLDFRRVIFFAACFVFHKFIDCPAKLQHHMQSALSRNTLSANESYKHAQILNKVQNFTIFTRN